MHQIRQAVTTKLPIPRKGTTYVARALNHHRNAVPVLIAVRDMLRLAQNAREVKRMIRQQLLKINGRVVRDPRESIKLFNLFEADKRYRLTLLPTGKFALKEIGQEDRLGKVIGKRLLKEGKVQLNLHDGTNVLTLKRSIAVGDSVYLNGESTITGHVPLEKGREVFVIVGKHQGKVGKIASIEQRAVRVSYGEGTATLDKRALVVLK